MLRNNIIYNMPFYGKKSDNYYMGHNFTMDRYNDGNHIFKHYNNGWKFIWKIENRKVIECYCYEDNKLKIHRIFNSGQSVKNLRYKIYSEKIDI